MSNQIELFQQKIQDLRQQALTIVKELTKDESKRDYDAIVKLINESEQLEGDGAISWALDRIKSISPSVNEAESKLNEMTKLHKYKI